MGNNDRQSARFPFSRTVCWRSAILFMALLITGSFSPHLAAQSLTGEDAEYTRVITQRAEKIVAELNLDDAVKAQQVLELLVEQYRNLGQLHDKSDTEEAKARSLFQLHRRFVAQLAAELTPEQVDRVKDGMTYGVLQVTYRRYLELLPTLTAQQRAVILAHLIEAREYAMDAGSSEEKHRWFGKYKGRINNFLSAEGFDLKQAEQEWSQRNNSGSGSGRRRENQGAREHGSKPEAPSSAEVYQARHHVLLLVTSLQPRF